MATWVIAVRFCFAAQTSRDGRSDDHDGCANDESEKHARRYGQKGIRNHERSQDDEGRHEHDRRQDAEPRDLTLQLDDQRVQLVSIRPRDGREDEEDHDHGQHDDDTGTHGRSFYPFPGVQVSAGRSDGRWALYAGLGFPF